MCGTKYSLARKSGTFFRFGALAGSSFSSQPGLASAEPVRRAEAGDVHGAARQHLLRAQLGKSWRLVADVLHHLHALRLQDRIVDILAQQPRVVAAPGADNAALGGARRANDGGRRSAARRRRARPGARRSACPSCSPCVVSVATVTGIGRPSASNSRSSVTLHESATLGSRLMAPASGAARDRARCRRPAPCARHVRWWCRDRCRAPPCRRCRRCRRRCASANRSPAAGERCRPVRRHAGSA